MPDSPTVGIQSSSGTAEIFLQQMTWCHRWESYLENSKHRNNVTLINGGLITCICWFLIAVCKKERDNQMNSLTWNTISLFYNCLATKYQLIFQYYRADVSFYVSIKDGIIFQSSEHPQIIKAVEGPPDFLGRWIHMLLLLVISYLDIKNSYLISKTASYTNEEGIIYYKWQHLKK